MKPLWVTTLAAALWVGCLGVKTVFVIQPDGGFEPILTDNGLADWHCFPENLANDWSVKDGQLIGRSSGKGSYLMWKGGDLKDFELKFDYRLVTDGNTGLQVRSIKHDSESHPLQGYHVDIGHVGIGEKVLGAWDFHPGHRGDYLAKRGEQVTLLPGNKRKTERIEGAFEPADANKRNWNHVHVYARGNAMWFTINNKVASKVIDENPEDRIDAGKIAFQLHSGHGMHVIFKDVLLKRH